MAETQTLTQTAAAAETHYRRVKIDGVEVAYREAGRPDAPAVLLLHGFPTSSRMFRNLIPALADRYHLIAPDYPGFGQSPAPDAFPTPSRPTPSWSRDSRTRSGSSATLSGRPDA